MNDYSTILATTDFSDAALAGVREAARLARALDSRVVLLYVVEDRMPPILDQTTWERAMAEHRATAERHLEGYAGEHLAGRDCSLRVVQGRPHEAIVEQAEALGADLIVMATHGYGRVSQALLGSTTDRVLRRAPCPVVAVRSGE